MEAFETAHRTDLSIDEMPELNAEQKAIVQKYSENGFLSLFSLPGGNVAVPLLSEQVSEKLYTHVFKDKVSFYVKRRNNKATRGIP